MTGEITKPQPGFTLVEILVAVAIFAVAAGLSLGLLTNYLKVQSNLIKQQNLSSALQFMMQSLTKDLREGRLDYDYYLTQGISLDVGVDILALRDVYGQQILYSLNTLSPGKYQLLKQGEPLQEGSIYLTQALFYVRPSVSPYSGGSNTSPYVIISFVGGLDNNKGEKIIKTLQTTVSSRIYDR